MQKNKGIISHIQRMSLHDGPGIRTTIFLKGCDLCCKWCHNPETFSIKPELQWIQTKCIHCNICINNCKHKALSWRENEIIRNKDICTQCNMCVSECYADAHQLIGKYYTINELYEKIKEDRMIYKLSNGGVTFSGGEPMMQYSYLEEILKVLKNKKIHVVLQTNLTSGWNKYENIFHLVDYWMCDLKHLDTRLHQYWTGKGNETILQNLRNLDDSGVSYCVRTPVIPGVNAEEEQLKKLSDFASSLKNMDYYQLIPFHSLAGYKYKNLGLSYLFENTKQISETEFLKLKVKYEINGNV